MNNKNNSSNSSSLSGQDVRRDVPTNGLQAWWLAARPKTLTGAASPVVLALSAVWASGAALQWLPAVLCLLFALLMQVDANLVNDYFDFRHGRDDRFTRLGPPRACSEGWVTPLAMKRAIGLVTMLACAVGMPLVLWGGWWLVGIGVACLVFCFLYTTWLAGMGAGDVLVLLFFGWVPVCATYFIQTGTLTPAVLLLATGMGLVTDCLLVVNNYRDRDQDRVAGKRTLVVMLGSAFAEWLYLALGIFAALMPLLPLAAAEPGQTSVLICCTLLFLFFHVRTWLRMKRIHHGRQLNQVLGQTAANILLYALLQSLALLMMNSSLGCNPN